MLSDLAISRGRGLCGWSRGGQSGRDGGRADVEGGESGWKEDPVERVVEGPSVTGGE